MNKLGLAENLLLLLVLLTLNCFALPKWGVTKLQSSNKEYTVEIVDTKEPWIYQLKILHNNVELAHYPFEEQLLTAYWSPSLKYVAINNHNGHRVFYV